MTGPIYFTDTNAIIAPISAGALGIGATGKVVVAIFGNANGVAITPGLISWFIGAGGNMQFVNSYVVPNEVGIPQYANNAAALAGGLTIGMLYHTGSDPDHVAIVDTTGGTSSSTLTIASGTFTLGTSSIPSDECVSVTGTVVNGSVSTIDPFCTSGHLCDTLTVNFAADPTGITGYPPSTTGTLTLVPVPEAAAAPQLKACNNTGSPIAPGLAVTYNWKYVR
jgi:hypothetical protein